MDELAFWHRPGMPGDYWYGSMRREPDRRFWNAYFVRWDSDYRDYEGTAFRAVTDDFGVLCPA